MVVGERFTKDGKTYEVIDVWGTNYSFKEVKDEPLPVFEETEEVKETPTFEEEVEEVIEAPKKRGGRRKKA